MTTLQPRPPYSDAELAELYPPTLTLQLVQVLLRHGERTPVTPRFQDTTGLPAFWPYCNAARHLRNAVLDPESGKFSPLEWKRRLEAFGHHDAPVVATGPKGELDGICDMGMLTDMGRETTTQLGQRLRTLYVDRLGFLPPSLSSGNADSLYLRSTPIPRALESLQQTLHGLYPQHTRAGDLAPLTILGRTPGDETLFPNDGNCRRFAALSRAFAQRAAERWNDTDDMAYLTKKLGKYMPDGGDKRVAVDGKPRLSGVMDTMNATNAHGAETKLPAAFYDPKIKQIIEKIGVEEWYAGYLESQEYRTLGIGGLMGDIVARMVGSVERTTADGEYEIQTKKDKLRPAHIRFGLSGCHDTTLAGALSSLGAYDTEAWPPFTSHIAIELFRDSSTPPQQVLSPSSASLPSQSTTSWISSLFGFSGSSKPGAPPKGIGRKPTDDLSEREKKQLEGYYVRLRYNDKPVTIPGCKLPGNHLEGNESFCTLVSLSHSPTLASPFPPLNRDMKISSHWWGRKTSKLTGDQNKFFQNQKRPLSNPS